LTGLREDWRRLLFPDATDKEFADGYAQAVTFGLLMAKARGIALDKGIDPAAKALRKTNSLIGAALHLLTEEADEQHALDTSLKTLTRVLDVIDWARIGKGDPEAWLYFYELFLHEYDNSLRKKTGSYYTPPPVVTATRRCVRRRGSAWRRGWPRRRSPWPIRPSAQAPICSGFCARSPGPSRPPKAPARFRPPSPLR